MAAIETPHEYKLDWRPGKGMFRRADGAENKRATGRKGIYEWVVKDRLHAAYHYPGGVQTSTPVVLLAPQTSGGKAYRACVEHNKAGL